VEVEAGHVGAGVAALTTRSVISIAGRPHSAIAFAAAAAASSGTAVARMSCRASKDGSAGSVNSGWLLSSSSVWWKWRFLIADL
jgi:hypothetical protein